MSDLDITDSKKQIYLMLQQAFGEHIREWLYNSPTIVEIEKNGDGSLWVDELGVGEYDTGIKMNNEDAKRIINIVASFTDTECTETKPILSANIPFTGERFQGMIFPVINEGSAFTIRKKASNVFPLDDYVTKKIMTLKEKEEIELAAREKRNILIVGSTSSGKTTLTNAILRYIASLNERLYTIEDNGEMQITAKNYVSTLSNDNVTAQDLLQAAMRMNPKRIIVGEVRTQAALDLLMAWNTGHPGGVATLHADSALDGLYRLEELIALTGSAPQPRMISRAVGLIIYIEGGATGRKVKEMATVSEYNRATQEYLLNYITGDPNNCSDVNKIINSFESINDYALKKTQSGIIVPKSYWR